MRDILQTLESWVTTGEKVALATVVSTWGSAPRKVGSKMAVRADGTMVGSVSGGCVEGAVAEAALAIIEGASPRLLIFGVSDDTAWGVGLACGGSIEVFVQSLDPILFQTAARQIHLEQTVGILTCIEADGATLGERTLIEPDGNPIAGNLDQVSGAIRMAIVEALGRGESGKLEPVVDDSPSCKYFLDVIPAPSKLVLVGGVHISIALAQIAKQMGYKTIVVDPRRLFASDERFPAVDRLIRSWPQQAFDEIGLDRETAIAVLTHDPKIDDPAILGALEQPVFYIGVLGSRKTHARRVERLKEHGVTDEQLARLHAPIGLNIGAQSPEEIALSIMGEIIAARRDLSGAA